MSEEQLAERDEAINGTGAAHVVDQKARGDTVISQHHMEEAEVEADAHRDLYAAIKHQEEYDCCHVKSNIYRSGLTNRGVQDPMFVGLCIADSCV